MASTFGAILAKFKTSNLFLIVLILVFTLSSAISTCFADVKIIDSNGLIRAVKVTDRPVHVHVVLQDANSDFSSVVLNHLDGVAPEIKPEIGSDGTLQFTITQAGSWQIKNLAQNRIKEVKIQE